MGIVTRMSRPHATASADGLEHQLRLAGAFGGPTKSGVSVTADSAMRVAMVFDCVRVLSEDIGKLPLILYRRVGKGGRERATDHPLYWKLHNAPNDWQTAMAFKENLQAHLCLRGNGYAYINRVGNEVRELLPLHPDKVSVSQAADFTVSYKVDGERVDRREIFHIPGLSLNGFSGVSVLRYAREAIGLALATEAHGARLFGNGALFRGILSHPQKLKDADVARRIRESFDEAHRGDGAHSTALIEEGMSYEKIGMSAEDSQFLGTREFQMYDIARWFRMPPHKVGLLKEAKFATIEHAALEYVVDTLLSWFIRWEQQIWLSLLTPAEQKVYFVEFLVDALLRGDLKSRYEAYRIAITTGFMNRNQARRMENWNPEPGLDSFLEPLNMTDAGDGEKEKVRT